MEYSTRFERLSIEAGLSQVSVNEIIQDRHGFIWIATSDGLNRFDGYNFKVFKSIPSNPNTLSDNFIQTLFEDPQGYLWIGTSGHGLNRYDPELGTFSHYKHDSDDPQSISHNWISVIFEDAQGHLWIGTSGGGLNLLDKNTGKFLHFSHDPQQRNSLLNDEINSITQDQDGHLWIGTLAGLSRFNVEQNTFTNYQNKPDQNNSLSHNLVRTIIAAPSGKLWIGTDNGLNLYDPATDDFQQFKHHNDNPYSLSNNDVRSLLIDHLGVLWVGTNGGGINYYDDKTERFYHYKKDSGDANSLSNNYIWALAQDHQNTLWIGTFGDGLNKLNLRKKLFGHVKGSTSNPDGLKDNTIFAILVDSKDQLWIGTSAGLERYNADTQSFVHYVNDPNNPNSISNNSVWAIYEDSSGILWVGTQNGGLNRYDQQTQSFTRYLHHPADPTSLSHNFVNDILQDSHGTLWVSTFGGGLNSFNPDSQTFNQFKSNEQDPHSISSNYVRCLFEDSHRQLWIGTDDGLNRYTPETKQFSALRHQPNNPKTISHNRVFSIYQQNSDTYWLATYGGGLNKLNTSTNTISHLRLEDGLPDEGIYAILVDSFEHLWLSTNTGLSKFNIKTQKFHNYDVNDGLQSNEFNVGAAFKAKDGALFFGGVNGFNRFYPEHIQDNRQQPPLFFTDFLLLNQSVPLSSSINPNSKQFTIDQPIESLEHLILSYKQDLISFEFAALHFSNPMKNQYAYRLLGRDQDWIYTDAKKRWATYSNLDAGDYTLQIKASNSNGHWNEQGKSLKITITPPPWETWWAYSIYLSCIIGLTLSFVHSQRKKVRYQKAINQRLQQVDKLKDEFLANTSHELRTPLNGIIGLAESLIDGARGPLPDGANNDLAMVVSCGKRLSNLINDVLDFSKLKNHNLKIHPKPIDLHTMVEVVLTLSRPLLMSKGLEAINQIDKDLPAVLADENRLQQILHNLIGNAIKFTASGNITITAQHQTTDILIEVIDTGIGIDPEDFDSLFKSFEQIEGKTSRDHSGTGLGLSVSKQLVELHGGQLRVSSQVGEGSTFSFNLPLATEKANTQANTQTVTRLHSLVEPQTTTETKVKPNIQDGEQYRILVVDDEPVNRQVLNNHLSLKNYQLIEVPGGQEALNMINNQGPFDLVLLDIMMPQVSGYDVCSQLRQQHSVNDLPVIFLTAKNQVSDMVHSFEVGANDYLSKPVSKHELLTRVETHLKFLDIHRNLEDKVEQRTIELERKNQQIIDTQQQLVQAEKMASLGTLTAGVAHEINNPNNFVHVSSKILSTELNNTHQYFVDLAGEQADEILLESFKQQFTPLHQHIGTILTGSERIKAIVDDLHTFTQLDSYEESTVVITDLIQATVNLLQTQHQQQVEFILDFKAKPTISCHPSQLNQVFMNLINNACYAIESNQQQNPGQIIIDCQLTNQTIEISIKDNGCGMDEQTQSRAFEPFYTTKEVGQGTGLGLSIAYGIIAQHQGALQLQSKQGTGTTLTILLPQKTGFS